MPKNLFSYNYLFETGITALSGADKVYWLFGIGLILVGILSAIVKRNFNPVKKKFWGRVQTFSCTIGIVALFWAALRYEAIRVLSARIVIWAIYFWALCWLYSILKYRFGKYKNALADYKKQQEKLKYM